MAFTDGNDKVWLQDTDAANVSAGAGDDIYFVSAAYLGADQKVQVTDTEGVNTLWLVGGLEIVSSSVTSNALLLKLNNGAEITLLGADTFSFVTGGSTENLEPGKTESFDDFVVDSLGYDAVPEAGDAPVSNQDSVTVDADGGTSVSPEDDGGEPGEGDGLSIAEALANLDNADKDLGLFYDGIRADEDLSAALGVLESDNDETVSTAIATKLGLAATALDGNPLLSNAIDDNGLKNLDNEANQTKYINRAKEDAQDAVDAVDTVEGLKALIEDMQGKLDAANGKIDAQKEAFDAMAGLAAGFAGANAINAWEATPTVDGNLSVADGQLGLVDTGAISADADDVYAEQNESGVWAKTDAGKGKLLIDDLVSKLNSLEQAKATTKTAQTALTNAVTAVVKKELGADLFKDLNNILAEGGVDAAGVKTAASVNTANSATYYDSAADKDAGDGVKAVYTINLAGAATAADNDIIKIGGVEAYKEESGAGKDAAAIAAGIVTKATINGIDGMNYAITAGDNNTTIVLTAQTVGDVTADVTVTAEHGATPPGTAVFSPTTEGVEAGDTSFKAITKTNDLLAALADQVELLGQIDDYNSAKELALQEKGFVDAITDAEQDLIDDGYILQPGKATSEDSDIIRFDNLDPDDLINGFGAEYTEGQADYLVATDYTLVKTEVETVGPSTKFAGEFDALEVFAVQNNNNVDLYFENEEAAGNLNYVGGNFTKIILTGMTLEDIDFADGIISAAL